MKLKKPTIDETFKDGEIFFVCPHFAPNKLLRFAKFEPPRNTARGVVTWGGACKDCWGTTKTEGYLIVWDQGQFHFPWGEIPDPPAGSNRRPMDM